MAILILLETKERRGGNSRLTCAMEEFCNFIDARGLIDLPFRGTKFSWCNGQGGLASSWAHLDKGLCNAKCLDIYPACIVMYLGCRTSDHSPMILGLFDITLKL